MNILVTGAKGFVGKNLVENLKNIRDKKNNTRPNILVDEIYEFEVDGNKLEAVQILPGYTRNIKNLSETEDLVTLMWANEQFNKDIPDTFFEKV